MIEDIRTLLENQYHEDLLKTCDNNVSRHAEEIRHLIALAHPENKNPERIKHWQSKVEENQIEKELSK